MRLFLFKSSHRLVASVLFITDKHSQESGLDVVFHCNTMSKYCRMSYDGTLLHSTNRLDIDHHQLNVDTGEWRRQLNLMSIGTSTTM